MVAALQGGKQCVGIEALGLDVDPAAEIVGRFEMGIVGGDGGQAPAFVEQLVPEIEAVAAVVLDGAAVIVDLDRMGAVDGAAILDGKLRPGRMGDGDEAAGLVGAAGKSCAGFARGRLGKIERQAGADDVPELAGGGFRAHAVRPR